MFEKVLLIYTKKEYQFISQHTDQLAFALVSCMYVMYTVSPHHLSSNTKDATASCYYVITILVLITTSLTSQHVSHLN